MYKLPVKWLHWTVFLLGRFVLVCTISSCKISASAIPPLTTINLLFYHQKICKHLKSGLFFLPRAPGFFFWNLSKLRGEVVLNVGEATQMTRGPNTLGVTHPPKCTVPVALYSCLCLQLPRAPAPTGTLSHSAWLCSANSSTILWLSKCGWKRELNLTSSGRPYTLTDRKLPLGESEHENSY